VGYLEHLTDNQRNIIIVKTGQATDFFTRMNKDVSTKKQWENAGYSLPQIEGVMKLL